MRIEPGRRTHQPIAGGEVTVFVIGFRVNRPWRVDAWGPLLLAMGPMLRELHADPASGFLGARTLMGAGGPTLVQYWRSPEDLYRYAADPDAGHRPSWTAFNARAKRVPGAVGIWHETYAAAAAESIYVDMPPTGLARALGSRAVGGRLDRARDRLGRATR